MTVAESVNDTQPRDDRTMVTAALLLAMAVTALEQTVVSTAMPSIIASLKGLEIYPWVFSAYLLAATVSTPIYGKLADRWGRKRLLLFGLALFSLGSILSGQSHSMGELIAMRVVQGLGAGAVGPIVLTMLGDLFTLKERASVQSLFSGVWGLSSLVGPALGGELTDRLSWRWVFYVTVPFSLVAGWVLIRHVDEKIKAHHAGAVDWPGAVLLTAGSTALLLAVLRGNNASTIGVATFLALGIVLIVAFVWRERRAADPIVPLDLLVQGPIAAAIVGSFGVGVLLFAIDTYVPLFVQGVRGGSATEAGWTLTPLFVAWSISVFLAAWVALKLGFRTTAIGGAILITIGSGFLVAGAARPEWSRILFRCGLIVTGVGFGPTSLSFILSTQNAVGWGRRGVATAAVTFFRTMGGALGVGFLGATLSLALAHRLAPARGTGLDVAAALRPETHVNLTPEQLALVQDALGRTLRDVFIQMSAVAVVTLLAATRLASGKAQTPDDHLPEPETALAAFAE